jgi:hypothetical protein
MAREDTSGDQRLVAYIVPSAWTFERGDAREDHLQSPTANLWTALRGFLSERLPEYMVPSVCVTLETLPLTPNGKVNRHVLPAPEGVRPNLGMDYVPPQTELEQTIAAVWHDVLQIKAVGIHDNFFEVGGNSLLLVQAHRKICEKLNDEIPVVELFRYPTIHALAQYLSRGQDAQPSLQHIQDRAKRQMELRKAEAVNRQREFMEARRQQKKTVKGWR